MHLIGILSDSHDWHSEEIDFFLKKNNCDVIKLNFDDFLLKLKNNKITFLNNKRIAKLDGIWVRYINTGSIEEITTKLTILHLLEKMKIYVHNSATVIEKTVDKIRTTGLLEIHGLKSPETFVSIGNQLKKFPTNKKYNYLLKPIFGSQGKDIFLISNPNKSANIKAKGNVFYLQRFLKSEEKKFSDYRVLVSNHRVISVMERSSEHFITNVFQGAQTKKITVKNKLEKICIKVSKIFNLGYGGIDIKLHKKKYYVIEVNGIPSWKGIQKIEEKNISEILVKDFLRKI